MSISKIITSTAVIASMLTASFSGIATALAEPFNDHGRGGFHAPAPNYRPSPVQPHRSYVDERRHHGGDNIGKALAIGVGAAIIGGIIASEANRNRDRGYD